MSEERSFSRLGPVNADLSLVGKTFLGQIREFSIEQNTVDGPVMTLTGGIWLYDFNSRNLGDPFMKILEGFEGGFSSAGAGGPAFQGVPLENLFCFVTILGGGRYQVECQGVTNAWFEPTAGTPGFDAGWQMIGNGGLVSILPGKCPFLPPLGFTFPPQGDPDLRLPCWPGFSPSAPLFATSTIDTIFGGVRSGLGFWQAEFQACDSADPNLDPGNGPRSAWNTLSQNCCHRTEGDNSDDDPGSGDTEPPPSGGPCDNALFCKIICKRIQIAPGFPPRNIWCFPTEGGRLTDYCVTDSSPPQSCSCSDIDVAGNQIPDPATVAPGTVIFVKCVPWTGGEGFSDCSLFPGA
jgi:hypothetical protein